MRQTPEDIKAIFEHDIEDHTMEVLQDDGLYRHLKFTDNGSQCYRFDIHTWPGYLCVCGDMGTWVFSRINDMFEFFIMDDNDFNQKHVINPHYWSQKLQAVDGRGGSGFEEFSDEIFEETIWEQFNSFAADYEDEDDEVTEAYPEGTQSYKEMLDELKAALQEEVIDASADGEIRAYDAAMSFNWKSDCEKLQYDLCDFWDHNCRDYTFHYIWILYAIVWGITEYNSEKEAQVTGMVAV